MMDSLPYRNDAAIVFRRLIRSLPRRKGVLGIATCDKGLPAMMMALAGSKQHRRRAHARRRDASAGGGRRCRQDPIDRRAVRAWRDQFDRSGRDGLPGVCITRRRLPVSGNGGDLAGRGRGARDHDPARGAGAFGSADLARSGPQVGPALVDLAGRAISLGDILTDAAIRNAMVVHAAFGGSTNLLLHIPAIAFAAGLRRPTVDDWHEVNLKVPRLVSVLPNGPFYHPTVRAYLAGGVPEVMLHLRALDLLDLNGDDGFG